MLIMLAAVLTGSALVLGRLSSGASVDLNRLDVHLLDLSDNRQPANPENTPPRQAAAQDSGKPEKTGQPRGEQKQQDPAGQKTEPGRFTLTLGGTVQLSGEVRKNSISTDSRDYDYSDVMLLLTPCFSGDLNGVFFQNILSDDAKAGDTVAPESAADLLKEARIRLAACGFSGAYDRETAGVESTLMALTERGIFPAGLREEDEQETLPVRNVGGVRTAFLQYTDTVPSKTRKNMEKAGTSGMVPAAEQAQIEAEIAAAREQGAEAVIVLLNWGKDGKDPDKRQKELAAAAAEAGADLIVGCGSLVPQTAEYLKGKDGRSVLCVWSLGSLLSGNRSNIRHTSGFLLHVTVRSNGKGGADILNPEYTPVYTWKYKQDGRIYYRCLASDGGVPDGMDSEQQKNMAHSAELVEQILAQSPLSRRERE